MLPHAFNVYQVNQLPVQARICLRHVILSCLLVCRGFAKKFECQSELLGDFGQPIIKGNKRCV